MLPTRNADRSYHGPLMASYVPRPGTAGDAEGAAFRAAASAQVAGALAGSDRPARWLGRSASALYLELSGGPVIAVLTADATRLPCGVTLPWLAAERPLNGLVGDCPGSDPAAPDPAAPDPAAADLAQARVGRTDLVVGKNRLAWRGPAGPITIRIVRSWAPSRVAARPSPDVRPSAVALRRLGRSLAGTWARLGIPEHARDSLAGADRFSAGRCREPVLGLLGRGTGLTPAGDDLLAGFLLGDRAFGGRGRQAGGVCHRGTCPERPGELRQLVRELAPGRTTALSAQLLGYACDGYCVDEAVAVISALAGNGDLEIAVRRLLAVGHTSGAALAWGIWLAA